MRGMSYETEIHKNLELKIFIKRAMNLSIPNISILNTLPMKQLPLHTNIHLPVKLKWSNSESVLFHES